MPGGRPTAALPSLRFRRVRALVLLLVVVSVGWTSVYVIRERVSDADSPDAIRAGTARPTSQTAAAELASSAGRQDADAAGRLSIAVTDISTGVTAAYGPPERAFVTASIVKVDILAALMLQRSGRLSRKERDLARRMIESSSNGAASTLWRRIGGAKGLDRANAEFGLTSTAAGRGGAWGTTTTTAADQLQLLRVVFTADSPLDARSRAFVRTLMGRVVPDQDWGISAADTRTGTRFAVKNGWLPRSKPRGWTINSIGSIEHHGHPLLIVALSDGRPSKERAVRVLEQVSLDAARAVTGV